MGVRIRVFIFFGNEYGAELIRSFQEFIGEFFRPETIPNGSNRQGSSMEGFTHGSILFAQYT